MKEIPKGQVTVAGNAMRDYGLTPKQAEFAMLVAGGASLVSAYQGAYDAEGMKLSSQYSEASKLMDNPKVADFVQDLLNDRVAKSMLRNAAYVRQHVFDRLMIESIDGKNAGAVRVRALELLGKVDVVGMFSESNPEQAKDRRSPEVIEQEIRAKLRRFLDIEPGTKGAD